MGDSKTMETLALAEVHGQYQSLNSVSEAPKNDVTTLATYESCTNTSYVGANILGKREIINYSYETRLKLADLAEELLQHKIKRIILLRKESELDYQVHDLILQEEYKQRSKAMLALAARKCLPSHNNSSDASIDVDEDGEVDDITQMKETRLFDQMMDITSRRNQLLIDLDIERLREEEEENEIVEEHKQLKIALQNLRDTSSTGNTPTDDHVPEKMTAKEINENKRRKRKTKLNNCFLC